MKPAEFTYHRPASIAEAVQLLAVCEEPKLLAGGQSLVPLLNMRLAQPTDVVDLARIDGIDEIVHEDGVNRVGAMVRQGQAERDRELERRVPLLIAALRQIAHPQIRSRGTVGGSIAHADPAAELPAVALALGAEMIAEGRHGRRVIGAADFFQGFLTTALDYDEVLVEVRFPDQIAGDGWACVEVARRRGDYALAGAMVVLRASDGVVADSRIVGFSVGDVPIRAHEAEAELAARPLGDAAWSAAAAAAAAPLSATDDLQATGAYRRHLAAVVVRRALEQAARRCA
jgi:carbon-monoxide dehydrogenase medium subunit